MGLNHSEQLLVRLLKLLFLRRQLLLIFLLIFLLILSYHLSNSIAFFWLVANIAGRARTWLDRGLLGSGLLVDCGNVIGEDWSLLEDVDEALDVGTGCFLIIFVSTHKNLGIVLQVQLGKLSVLIEAGAVMLEVKVREKTCVNVFTEELTHFKYHLILESLKTKKQKRAEF